MIWNSMQAWRFKRTVTCVKWRRKLHANVIAILRTLTHYIQGLMYNRHCMVRHDVTVFQKYCWKIACIRCHPLQKIVMCFPCDSHVIHMWSSNNTCESQNPCVSHVTYSSHVKFHMWNFTCEISHVKFHMWNFTCGITHVKFHMWNFTCEISRVTYFNTGNSKCEISHATC